MKPKTVILTLILSISMLLQVGCHQQAEITQEPTPVSKEGPKIEFENLEYDFGKVGPGQKLNGQFKFTNTGDALLKITKVQKCCGAVTKLDKDALAPGESGVLDVQYTSSRSPIKMSKRLYIESNDKALPRATLTIRAETVLKVNYEPKSLKLLLKEGTTDCPKITLTSTDDRPFSITKFASTGNCLTADFDSSVEATEFVLEPKVAAENLQKNRFGRLSISMAFSQPEPASETATIMFRVLSRFSLTPAMLMVLYDKPGEPVKKTFWLTNNYGEDFEVESTASKEGHIKVIDQRKVGNRYQFSLEITPPSDNIENFTDTFTIGLKDEEPIEVPCRGIFRKPRGVTTNTSE